MSNVLFRIAQICDDIPHKLHGVGVSDANEMVDELDYGQSCSWVCTVDKPAAGFNEEALDHSDDWCV